MITKTQAIEAGNAFGNIREIHYTGKHDCYREFGPRGSVKTQVTAVRPSGKCQTWKTRPDDFRLPVKYGMYESSAIDQSNAIQWHIAADCPLNDPAIMLADARRRMEIVGLSPEYDAVLFCDWSNMSDHIVWMLTARLSELRDFCQTVKPISDNAPGNANHAREDAE